MAQARPTPPATAATIGEWPFYHHDLASTRYSPLDQISKASVTKLAVAWRWKPDSANFGGAAAEYRNESTPIMVKSVLYFTSGQMRAVVAADAATGTTKWVWRMDEGTRVRIAPRRGAGRGVSYWTNGTEERIFVVTPGFELVALDAKTGKQIPTFGTAGVVDLKMQLGVPVDVETAAIGSSSPPLIFEDVVVIGPALEVGTRPPSYKNVPGRILALDAKTGALKWRFNTIPQAGEFGVDTWENESWKYTGNAGAWAPLTLDTQRGYLYLPVEAATGDNYGGHRLGDNLFSTSLVCLDIRTGKRIWHYQIVHHDIWDYDNPTAPILADITVDGRRIQAVAQITKQSFVYVFDRVTGAPVWPIVERPMPASDVPGERAAATQPIPSKPQPFDRQGVTIDDLIDFTPALRAQAVELVKPFRLGPLFAPPSLLDAADGTKGTISLPGNLGGGNWEHGAFDPETGMLYVGSYTNPTVLAMGKDAQRSDMNFVMVGGRMPTVSGLPLIKPPYSRITAFDLNRGERTWTVASSETPDAIRNNPALQGLTIPETGGQSRPVVLATKTLVFTIEGLRGQSDFRALDKATGAVVWKTMVPGVVSSSPMTFLAGGKQFVAFWVGDQASRLPSEFIAFAVGGPGGG
jgi:quinoprotein glucose dehydrogenase